MTCYVCGIESPTEGDKSGGAFLCRDCEIGASMPELAEHENLKCQPWVVEGITELDYWRKRYLEARKDAMFLYSALAFIRDCEDDDELGVSTNRAYLKNQAATAMEGVTL